MVRRSPVPALVALMPHGRTLPPQEFRRRHIALLVLLWLHVPALGIFAVSRGTGLRHALVEAGAVAALAAAGTLLRMAPRLRATAVALGLMTASAVLVHLWDGRIEAHFHFFVMVYVLALYEDWLPFGLSIAYVVLHHGLLSTLDAASVFDHPGALDRPWVWALIHGGFILASSAAAVTTWRMNESTRARMDHQALHDPLTGLPNRRLLVDRLELALLRSRRTAVGHALLFVDLDGFKWVNDSLGHHAGDRVLLRIAGRLDGILRADDTVARFGGDEFTILAEHVTEDGALELADRILRAVAEPIELDGQTVTLSASIGIAPMDASQPADALLRDADAAMYRAKERGRGNVEVFDAALRERIVRRVELEQDLRHAIERSQLCVHYQPTVTLATGGIVGFEALVRWEHPARGLVPPGQFIPLAEETGLIHPIGEWVLREACEQLVRFNADRGDRPPLTMSVNLSRRQFERPDLVRTVARVLDATGIPPALLCLEITETAVMTDVEASVALLLGLRGLGVRLAIDDFGVGFSSLSELKRLPSVDVLKIDKSFVDGIESDEDRAIVAAILSLADVLGLTTLAEGVEHQVQVDGLEVLGCELGQGFHWSRPQPAEVIDSLLAAPAAVAGRPA